MAFFLNCTPIGETGEAQRGKHSGGGTEGNTRVSELGARLAGLQPRRDAQVSLQESNHASQMAGHSITVRDHHSSVTPELHQPINPSQIPPALWRNVSCSECCTMTRSPASVPVGGGAD